MTSELGIEVRAVASPRQAVENCDIVVAATNANQPVFDGDWLVPGQHVVTLNGSDAYQQRQEIDETTVRRSNVIVVNYREQIERDRQPEVYASVQKGIVRWDQIYELGSVLRGRVSGRTNDEQITLHDDKVGMGIQFATVGAQLLARARERGVGRELPLDAFRTYTEGKHSP